MASHTVRPHSTRLALRALLVIVGLLGLWVGDAAAGPLASPLVSPTPPPLAAQIHGFDALNPDPPYDNTGGAHSYAPLLRAADGKLYGTTSQGGLYGQGTVFRVNEDGSMFETVYDFNDAVDHTGMYPVGGLAQGGAPNFYIYGTSSQGGANDFGTIFRIDPSVLGSATLLHAFDETADGANPTAGVILATIKDGDFNDVPGLYGTASNGGSSGAGTLYKMTLDGSFFQTMVHFNFCLLIRMSG